MYMMYEREGNSPYIHARVYPYKSFRASDILLSNGTPNPAALTGLSLHHALTLSLTASSMAWHTRPRWYRTS